MPIILATQKAEVRRTTVQSHPLMRPYLEKPHHEKRAGGVARAIRIPF
jgi:hypothetical protein